MLNFKNLSLLLCLGAVGSLAAVQPRSELSLSTGLRVDEVKTFITAEQPKGVPFLTNDLKACDINLAQIGLQGVFALPSCWSNCDCWWLDQFYVKGYAYWGHAYHGSYRSYNKGVPDEEFLGDISRTTGDICKGRSYDYNIGLGWVYPICDWGIGISGGYAWDKLDFKVDNALNSFFEEDTCICPPEFVGRTQIDLIAEGLKYTNKWKGPWIGANILYSGCDWHIDLGYEYHWLDWDASFKLAVPDDPNELCLGFSDVRKGDGHGNVVYLNAGWVLADCWDLTVGLKYTSFKADGKEYPANGTFRDIGCFDPETGDEEYDRVNSAKWRSAQVTVDLGYLF